MYDIYIYIYIYIYIVTVVYKMIEALILSRKVYVQLEGWVGRLPFNLN